MPRVSSQRTRQAILVTDAIDPLVDPEKLVLLDQFGDPISLSSAAGLPVGGVSGQMLVKSSDDDYDTTWIDQADPVTGLPAGGATGKLLAKHSGADGDVEWVSPPPASDTDAMHFKGLWDAVRSWIKGDVVLNGTSGLYILTAASLVAGQTAPKDEVGLVNTTVGPASGPFFSNTCYRLVPETGDPATSHTQADNYFFFDVLTGGTATVTIPGITGDYIQAANAAGTSLGNNSSSFGTPLVFTLAGAGRYFVKCIDAFASTYTNNPHVALSGGATFDPGNDKWKKIGDTVA